MLLASSLKGMGKYENEEGVDSSWSDSIAGENEGDDDEEGALEEGGVGIGEDRSTDDGYGIEWAGEVEEE